MTQIILDKETISSKSRTQTGYVIQNNKLSKDIYQMTIENPEISELAVPGQFVSIYCKSLILRRPFSISNTTSKSFQILYKVIGNGTQYLSSLTTGDCIDLIGPLGNNFSIINDRSLLIGAGVGIAPIAFLAKTLVQKQIQFKTLLGLKTILTINLPENMPGIIVTEDKTSIHQGLITHYIENEIESFKPKRIYACGPRIVLKKAFEISKMHNIDIEIALEEKFACGIGVCMGCVVETYENNKIVNKRICKDGPVFKGENIVW